MAWIDELTPQQRFELEMLRGRIALELKDPELMRAFLSAADQKRPEPLRPKKYTGAQWATPEIRKLVFQRLVKEHVPCADVTHEINSRFGLNIKSRQVNGLLAGYRTKLRIAAQLKEKG